MERRLTVYTDGAARGNPGPSASGFMVYEGGKLLHRHSEYNGKSTNNHSEYRAVALALKWCVANLDAEELHVSLYSDNELVVRQLNGRYKMKSESLRPLNEEIRETSRKFGKIEFRNVRRENIYIAAVDRSLNELLDRMED
ncbi:MAG: ribonuclease HI family protein [Candidatus Micrarchaeota archaeon]|nr:ribonuclease HI family protein [Candidatus Micrarchaeota archaeon]